MDPSLLRQCFLVADDLRSEAEREAGVNNPDGTGPSSPRFQNTVDYTLADRLEDEALAALSCADFDAAVRYARGSQGDAKKVNALLRIAEVQCQPK